MKKTVSMLSMVLCMSMVFVSFAFGTASSEAESGPATITVWDFKYGDVDNVQPAMKKIDDLIMKENPDIIIDHVAQSNDNYYQVVRAAIQAGDGPDIVMFHGGVQAYEFDDFTVPLDSYIESWRDEISEYSWAFCSEGGDGSNPVHLVPLTVQGFGIYYNKSLFEEAGLDPDNPPSDLDSFMAACETLKAAGITPVTAGFQGGPFTLDFMIRTFVANIYGPAVGDLVTGGQSFAGNAQFKQVIQAIKKMFANDYFSDDGTSVPYFVDAINNFSAGKGAMFVGLVSDIGHWKNFGDALGKDNVGYFPVINMPGAKYSDVQVLQPCGIGYSIMTWSKNKDKAAKVIEGYARGEGNALWMGMTGALSPNKELDINSLGYPLVGEILANEFDTDFNTLLLNEDANQNMGRYLTQYFVSDEISEEQFIASFQKMLDNAKDNK